MTAPPGPDPGDLDVRISTIDGGCTLTVTGDIDVASAPFLSGWLEQLLARPDVTAVELDLSGVTFLNSIGLTALVVAHRSAQHAGRVLRIRCGSRRAVRRPLEITGLLHTLTIVDAEP